METPTLVILTQDGRKSPVTIPQGAIVEALDGALDGSRRVDLTWEGKTVMMFALDLQDRGAPID